MIDRNESIRNVISSFSEKPPKGTFPNYSTIANNLGLLLVTAVNTDKGISVGRISIPKSKGLFFKHTAAEGAKLAAFIHDENNQRQLWLPYFSVDLDKNYNAEITATNESSIADGWKAAQAQLTTERAAGNYEVITEELLHEARIKLRAIGAVAVEPNGVLSNRLG